MKLRRILRSLLYIFLIGSAFPVHADDKVEINGLVSLLYKEDVKALLCSRPEGGKDIQLITVPEKYFSLDFMKYYYSVCEGTAGWLTDPRTSETGLYAKGSKAEFTNLTIGQPKITVNRATIRTTYDLPVASYEEYGNYTVFKLIKENDQWKIDDIELGGHDMDRYNKRESMTALISYKSVKQYIKKSLKEAENKK